MTYATVSDFFARYPRTIADGVAINDTTVAAALEEASAFANSYLRGRYNLPILGSVAGGVGVFDPAIVVRVCHIAAYNLMTGRGFNPVPGGDELIRSAYYEAVGFPNQIGTGWFPAVQRQSIHPDVLESSANAPAHPFPSLTSAQPRGWNR